MSFKIDGTKFKAWADDGTPLVGGLLYTYESGTTANKATYTNSALNVANTNPITLDARGEADVWLGSGAYTFVLKTAAGVTIDTVDGVIAAADIGNNTDATQGAGAVGFLYSLAYAPGTIGKWLKDLALSAGAGFIGYGGPGSSVTGSVAQRLSWDVYVTDPQFGAVGDGSTDSTTALAAAATYANSLCDVVSNSVDVARFPRLIFPPSLGFKTTATLSIRAGVEVIMESPLLVSAAAGTPIIGIDMIDAKGVDFQAPRNTASVFDVRRITQSNWTSENDIGVRIVGLYVGSPHFKRISGFTVGVNACLGYGSPTFGDIRDAKKGAIITSRAAPQNFTNQLKVGGGAFSCAAGVGVGLSRYGVVLSGIAPNGINTVVCDGQSFELAKSVALPGESIPWLIDGSAAPIAGVRIINQRSEGNGSTFARLLGSVREVEIGVLDGELEYTYPTALMLDDQSTGSANVLYRHHGATAPQWKEFFSTGRFSENVTTLTGGTISIANLEAAISVGAAPLQQTFVYAAYGPTFDASGYMTNAGPLYGVRVRLNGARSIAISGRKPSNQPVNVSVLCYDSAGVQIYAANTVFSGQSAAAVTVGVYGGVYQIGLFPANTATTFDGVLGFTSNVATVFIAVTSACDGYALKRVDARPEWYSLTRKNNGLIVGNGTPIATTNITHSVGSRVAQVTPVVGQPKGWVCTVAGTPGTWVSEGNL